MSQVLCSVFMEQEAETAGAGKRGVNRVACRTAAAVHTTSHRLVLLQSGSSSSRGLAGCGVLRHACWGPQECVVWGDRFLRTALCESVSGVEDTSAAAWRTGWWLVAAVAGAPACRV